jgi:hypothetical protein
LNAKSNHVWTQRNNLFSEDRGVRIRVGGFPDVYIVSSGNRDRSEITKA